MEERVKAGFAAGLILGAREERPFVGAGFKPALTPWRKSPQKAKRCQASALQINARFFGVRRPGAALFFKAHNLISVLSGPKLNRHPRQHLADYRFNDRRCQ